MYRLGQKVIFVGDHLEQNLPIGDYGFIIAYDRNPDQLFEYAVRIPKLNRNVFVVTGDIEPEEALIEKAAEEISRQALIDYALATKNEELFQKIMGGEKKEEAEKATATETVQKDFIRQVNIKAWI